MLMWMRGPGSGGGRAEATEGCTTDGCTTDGCTTGGLNNGGWAFGAGCD